MTDPNGHTTSLANDAMDHLTSVTGPDGAVTTYTYDPNGNVAARVDANGHRTTYSYDGANRPASMTSPAGQVWQYGYDADGNRVNTTLPAATGAPAPVITDSYDALNRPTGTTYPDGTPAVTYRYDANGNRSAMTDGRGTVNYTYDPGNHLTATTRGADTVSYTYDADGNTLTRSYPGTTATYTYDADGRMASAQIGSATTTYSYDPAGERVTTTLPAESGLIETRSYDTAGRPVSVVTKKGSTVVTKATQTYDPAGNPTQIGDTTANPTTLTYDTANRVTEACYATSSCAGAANYIGYSYDPVGNRLTETRPKGTNTYSYNAADQHTSQNGLAGAKTFGYDPRGNQTTSGNQSFSYDLANRLSSETEPAPPAPYTPTVQGDHPTAYWHLGETSGATAADSSGNHNDGTYSTVTLGAPKLVTAAGGDPAASFDGTTSSVTLPPLNLTNTSFSIEAWIKPTSLTAASQTVFGADGGSGTDQSLQLRVTSDGRAVLAYQGDDLATTAKIIKAGTVYHLAATYDASSDTTTLYVNGANKANGHQGPFNGTTPAASIGQWKTAQPDHFNGVIDEVALYPAALTAAQVTAHYKSGKAQSAGSKTTTYAYDGDGNRLETATGPDPAQKDEYLWDTTTPQVPQIALERDGAGNTLRSYGYGANRISMTTGGTNHYYAYDILGSVTRLNSATGTPEWTYKYEPYGATRTTVKNDVNAPANPMQYVGEYNDPADLYNLRARMYDPKVGRFTSTDPVPAEVTDPYVANYVYAENNPLTLTDPTGQLSIGGFFQQQCSGWLMAIGCAASAVGIGALIVGAVAVSPAVIAAAAGVGIMAAGVGIAVAGIDTAQKCSGGWTSACNSAYLGLATSAVTLGLGHFPLGDFVGTIAAGSGEVLGRYTWGALNSSGTSNFSISNPGSHQSSSGNGPSH